MQTVLIAGGTGFVGKHLVQLLLQQGYRVHIFSRKKNNAPQTGNVKMFYWNPEKEEYDPRAFDGVETLVNLSGAGVADKRWTDDYKKEIISSRTQSIRVLAKALKETVNNTVHTVINASATGWYGADTAASVQKGGFTEDDPPAETFFGVTCKQWEDAAQVFHTMEKRLVILRIGIVLHSEGGMLKELLKPLRFGIAPILGKPGRMISWIQMQDLCRMILFAAENKQINGVYNAVNIVPAVNSKLVTAVARSRNRFFIKMRVPDFLLKIIAGEFSTELLNSVSVSGKKIADAGFTFRFPDITPAVSAS